MKTLYKPENVSSKIETLELKVRSDHNDHIFFQFQFIFCCILFLFSYSTIFGQSAIVNTDKQAYLPGENIIITGSVWSPNEQVSIIIKKLDLPADNDTVIVTANAFGEINDASYSIAPSEYNTVYNVYAKGEVSLAAAKTSFSNKLGLSQGHNGGIGDTPISPIVWVNGNANAQNSHYIEGNSIPYRVILDDVPTGTHTIRLKWDIKHSGKHALDFITSYNRSAADGGISETVDPLSDLPAGIFSTPKYFSVPTPAAAMVVNGKPQPTTAFLALPAADRRIAAFNATITNIVYLYEGNIADANSTTEIEITYEVVNGPQFVLFAWSGHIASRLDWGPGSSAGNINGSPYHTALGISDYINGAQDRSLKADAVQFFPTCSLSEIPDACAGDTVSVTATTNAPSPQFTWSATNGAVVLGSGASVQVKAPQSGSFVVSVIIVDYFDGQVTSEPSECSDTVGIKQDPVVSVGADQMHCLAIGGRDFEVSGSVSFGAFEWVVVSGNATIDSVNSLTTMVHLDANSNEVTLRLQAIGSCADQSDDINLKVNLEPVVDINVDDDPSCQDSTGQYSVPNVAGQTYQWSISGDAHIDGSSTGNSVSVIVNNQCSVDFSLSLAVTDSNGCIGYDTLQVSFADSIPPLITQGPGADSTIACPSTPQFFAPVAQDNCDIQPVLHQINDVRVDGGCAAEYSLTRKWYFTDACGNVSDTVSQTINVIDTLAPIIVQAPGADTTISCPGIPQFTPPQAQDGCDGSPIIHQLEDEEVAGSCDAAYSITRRWYFTDSCGNISDTVSQTINVVDTIAPVITQAPGADTTISCPGVPQFSAPLAEDNCDAEPEIHQLEDERVDGNCDAAYSITRRWYFTDACGNISDTVSQTINVVDTIAPVITQAPGADTTISCPGVPQFSAPLAEDNCDAEPEIHQLEDERVDGNCDAAYSITRRWYFTDACGNISDTVSQTINVVDTIAPIFISDPGADISIACIEEPVFTPPIASDECSTFDLIPYGPDTTYVNNEMVLTMSWYAVDACGNISDTVHQAITIRNCTGEFCTLTQGFYGNAKGVACATGERGRDLMLRLLGVNFGPLVIGSGGRTLTINAGDVDCLIASMPAGGPASILPAGNASYNLSCNLPTGYHSGNGNNKKFRNVFLGQLITLGLNLRLDVDLAGLELEGTQLMTFGSHPSNDGLCGTEDDMININDTLIRYIPQSVLSALDNLYGGNRSVANLYLLANRIIGGEVIAGVSLSNINQAVSSINEGFDHCRFLGGFSSLKDQSVDIVDEMSGKEISYKVYPNPFSQSTTIEFVVENTTDVRIEIFSINGEFISTLFDERAEGNREYQVILDGSMLQNGMYFCRIYSNGEVHDSRIIVNK